MRDRGRPVTRVLAAVLATLALCVTAHVPAVQAQGEGQPAVVTARSLAEQISAAFRAEDYVEAASLVDVFLERWPNHPDMLYNAACAYAQLGQPDKAADFLFQSVEHGFTDFSHMERDGDLDPVRDHPVYVKLLEARDTAYERVAVHQLNRAREQFGDDGYAYETDTDHRLAYAVALDTVAFREMRSMLSKQADQLAATLFDAPPDYFVLIAVPTPDDAGELIRDRSIGGLYEHGRRRLIARDIGSMLRHEFTHLMHYGHMERIGQSHALWVQEGISSLYESYTLGDNGAIEFLANNRHNMLKIALRRNRAIAWEHLMQMPASRFMDRAGITYPQVRSIFRWLAEQDKLTAWYDAYVATYDEDRSGTKAFEVVFDEPLDRTEARWRAWVNAQPMRDEWVVDGDASLGVQMARDSHNDGVEIAMTLTDSAAADAGLRAGDVIVEIDYQPTRSAPELVELIAAKNVGDRVRVRYRRGATYGTAYVTLRPLQGR